MILQKTNKIKINETVVLAAFLFIVSLVFAVLIVFRIKTTIILTLIIAISLFIPLVLRKSVNIFKLFVFLSPLYYLPALFLPEVYLFIESGAKEMYFLKYAKDVTWAVCALIIILYIILCNKFIPNWKQIFRDSSNKLILACLFVYLFLGIILGFINIMLNYNLQLKDLIMVYLMGLRQYFEYILALPFLYIFINNKAQLKDFLKIILLSAVFVVLFAIYQALFGRSVYGYGNAFRLYSSLLKPMSLGMFLSLVLLTLIPTYFYYIRYKCDGFSKLFLKNFIITSFIILLLTISMSSIAAFFIGIIILLYMFIKNKYPINNLINTKHLLATFLILNILGIGFIYFLNSDTEKFEKIKSTIAYVPKRIGDIFSDKDIASDKRSVTVKTYINKVGQSSIYQIILGKGMFDVVGYAGEGFNTSELDFSGVHDNQYVRIHFNLGLMGILSFLGMSLFSILKLYKVYTKSQDGFIKGLSIGLAVYLVGYLWANYYVEMVNTFFPLNLYFWMIIGTTMLLGNKISIYEEKVNEVIK